MVEAFRPDAEHAVPTIFRFVLILAVLAALAFGGMIAVVALVQPAPREISVTVPAARLAPK